MMERTANDLKELLMENKVRFRKCGKRKRRYHVPGADGHPGKTALVKILNEQYSDLEIASTTSREGRRDVYLKEQRQTGRRSENLPEHKVETIRNRVDQLWCCRTRNHP